MVMMIMTQTPMGAIIMAFPHSALMTAVATSHVTTTYGTEMCLGTHLTKTSGLLLIQVLFSNFGIIKLSDFYDFRFRNLNLPSRRQQHTGGPQATHNNQCAK